MRVRTRLVLLTLASVHALVFVAMVLLEWSQSSGYRLSGGIAPVGGDFMNLWTAARMTLDGRLVEVYESASFVSHQWSLFGTSPEFRLWAYPPHSLLLIWPFGLLPYGVSLLLWSALGIVVLALGARRAGMPPVAIAFLATSPAALQCVFLGQTGNVAAGLLLFAVASKARRGWEAGTAAAVLTVKPQFGILIPIDWAFRKRWGRVVGVTVVVIGALLAITAVAGLDVWRTYTSDTLVALSDFERHGTGPFMVMVPSFFMAARVLGASGDLAMLWHLPAAVAALGYCIWRLASIESAKHRTSLILIGTVVMLPYVHIYDLPLVVAGVLIATPRALAGPDAGPTAHGMLGTAALLIAWAMPYVTVVGNAAGVPIAPVCLVALLLAADSLHRRAALRGDRNLST
jgi:alpha-1,2-mannosyltransferase